jgi:hypothetical protein
MATLKPGDFSETLFDEYQAYTNDFELELSNNLYQLRFIIEHAATNGPTTAAHVSSNFTAKDIETLSTSSSNTSSNSSSNQNSDSTGNNSSSKLTNYNQLNAHYKTLLDLYEYYKRLKLNLNASATGELKFVQYMIIKRLNYINNALFGINKRLVVDLTTTADPVSSSHSGAQSPLTQFANYDSFAQLEYNLATLKPTSLKLILNSINLNQFNGNNLIASTAGNEFNIIIYQFEKKPLTNQINHVVVDKTKKSSKKITFASKRSSSADNRALSMKNKPPIQQKAPKTTGPIDSLKLATLYLDKDHGPLLSSSEESLSDLDNNDLSYDMQLLNSKFALSEKCLSIKSVKFNQSLSTNVHTAIDVKPTCQRVMVVLYKLVRVNDEYVRCAVKYESFDLVRSECAHEAVQLTPTGSRVLTLEPMSSRNAAGSSGDDSQASSSVFRRMFKSKSSTRHGSSSRFRSTTAHAESANGQSEGKYGTLGRKAGASVGRGVAEPVENDSFLTMSVSSSRQVDIFLNESSQLVNIDIFDYWRSMWRPSVQCQSSWSGLELNNKEKRGEIVNIYFKSVRFAELNQESAEASHTNRRSKLDQYQLSKKRGGSASVLSKITNCLVVLRENRKSKQKSR